MRTRFLVVLLALGAACSRWATTQLPVPVDDAASPPVWDRARLHTADGRKVVLRVARADGDSIRGASRNTRRPAPSTPSRWRCPRARCVGWLVARAGNISSFESIRIPCGLLGEPCPWR